MAALTAGGKPASGLSGATFSAMIRHYRRERALQRNFTRRPGCARRAGSELELVVVVARFLHDGPDRDGGGGGPGDPLQNEAPVARPLARVLDHVERTDEGADDRTVEQDLLHVVSS